MSTLRKRYRVVLDLGEPMETTTSARDLVIGDDYSGPMAGFAVVHHSLVREGNYPDRVPEDFNAFVDALDEMEALEEPSDNGSTPDDLDPTPPAESGTAP